MVGGKEEGSLSVQFGSLSEPTFGRKTPEQLHVHSGAASPLCASRHDEALMPL